MASDRHFDAIYASPQEAAWAPLCLFKAMPSAIWYDLSDEAGGGTGRPGQLSSVLRFVCQRANTGTHGLVRFRAELGRGGPDRSLFAAVTGQYKTKGVTVRAGTLVDATLIASASIRRDGEARWAGHRRRKPVHG